MKAKKNDRADLENKKTLFLEIGMVIALTIVFAAFQWSTDDKSKFIFANDGTELIIDELPPITRPEPPKLAELPKPTPKTDFTIVDNKQKVEGPAPVFNVDPTQPIEIIPIAEELPIVEPEYVYMAEVMPEFEGGLLGLMKYLKKTLQYPDEAKNNNVQGKVFVEFIVNKKGKVERARVVKGIDPLLDAEALRVVNNLPDWKPGMQNQKSVSVCYTIPINFMLNTNN